MSPSIGFPLFLVIMGFIYLGIFIFSGDWKKGGTGGQAIISSLILILFFFLGGLFWFVVLYPSWAENRVDPIAELYRDTYLTFLLMTTLCSPLFFAIGLNILIRKEKIFNSLSNYGLMIPENTSRNRSVLKILGIFFLIIGIVFGGILVSRIIKLL